MPPALAASPPPLPLAFRQEIVPPLFWAIRGGWSCALVTMRGVGTSNLLRFAAEPRVMASHLGEASARTLIVYLEDVPPESGPALTRFIGGRIEASARSAAWPKAELAAIRRLSDGPFESLVRYLCGVRERRLVLAFDDFDRTFMDLSAQTLRDWRRLRDDHKHRLSFLVSTRTELARLAARRGDDVRKFTELFDQHTYPVRPYSQQDALELLARKTADWPEPLGGEVPEQLYRALGGHAKLLIAGLIFYESRRRLPWPEFERHLAQSDLLADVCREIWESLDEAEQTGLSLVAAERRAEVSESTLDLLRLKGLTTGRPGFIFAGVFEAFVKRQPLPSEQRSEGEARPPSRLRDPHAQVQW